MFEIFGSPYLSGKGVIEYGTGWGVMGHIFSSSSCFHPQEVSNVSQRILFELKLFVIQSDIISLKVLLFDISVSNHKNILGF